MRKHNKISENRWRKPPSEATNKTATTKSIKYLKKKLKKWANEWILNWFICKSKITFYFRVVCVCACSMCVWVNPSANPVMFFLANAQSNVCTLHTRAAFASVNTLYIWEHDMTDTKRKIKSGTHTLVKHAFFYAAADCVGHSFSESFFFYLSLPLSPVFSTILFMSIMNYY